MSNLNPQQAEGVRHTDGPVLILAGAGTGKTTVITNRIAHIINQNLATLDDILAVTFTNKAAGEMKERIFTLIDENLSGFDSWIGTFHSICLKILKIYPQVAGLKAGFSIADSSDQKQAMKQVMKELNISEKDVPIKLVMSKVSKLKENAIEIYDISGMSDYNQSGVDMTKIYPKYQEILVNSNLVDFDDLILLTIKLLKDQQIRAHFQEKFKYILVDEYQDTNKLQFQLISSLLNEKQNICCVGDDDQSIYSWRGADITNILNFQKFFPKSHIITLNNNYRSTQSILNFAEEIISQNTKRYEKNLQSNIEDQRLVKVISLKDDLSESKEVANIIKSLRYSNEVVSNKDIAILVRATSQMRGIEEALIRDHIPYKIIGGVKFYERKEIKDAVSYIKLILSDMDEIALERIINVPKRSIGEKTFDNIRLFAKSQSLPILQALQVMCEQKALSAKISESVLYMIEAIKRARNEIGEGKVGVVNIIIDLLEDIGYMQMMREEAVNDPSYEKKIDNINDLMNNLSRFSSLVDFFDHIALVSDADKINSDDVVNIMTIHASKGLEFDAVITTGWEQGLFPNQRVIDEGAHGVAEERRLAYVAITRAKRHLFILNSKTRFLYGRYNHCVQSSFLDRVSKMSYDRIDKSASSNAGNGGYNEYPRQFNHNVEQKPKSINKVAQYNQESSTKIQQNSISSSSQRIQHEKHGMGTVIKKIGNLSEIKFDNGIRMILQNSSFEML